MIPQTFFADVQTGAEAMAKAKDKLFNWLENGGGKHWEYLANEFNQIAQTQHGFAFKAFPDRKWLLKLVVEDANMDDFPAIKCVAIERHQHSMKHGRTVEHDAEFNGENQLARAAAFLSQPDFSSFTPDTLIFHTPSGWDYHDWEKMCSKPYKERLVIAASLLVAEVDRLDFMEKNPDFKP
jgi:hypothetical protein